MLAGIMMMMRMMVMMKMTMTVMMKMTMTSRRKGQVRRWHPDKFLQKLGDRIVEEEKDEVDDDDFDQFDDYHDALADDMNLNTNKLDVSFVRRK